VVVYLCCGVGRLKEEYLVMTVTFGKTAISLGIGRRLSDASDSLSRVFEQLSSGLRINRASDDAAGLAVSSMLNVKSRIFAQGLRNLSDGTSFLNIADNALSQLSNIVQRQIELAEQASNGILSSSQLAPLHLEAQELRQEYLRILETASFNNIKVLSGLNSTLNLQAGIGEEKMLSLDILEKQGDTIASVIQTITSGAPGFSSNSFSDTRFLTTTGADGKETLIALSVGTSGSSGRAALIIQTYRVNADGDLIRMSQQSVASAFSPDTLADASFAADWEGSRLRVRFTIERSGSTHYDQQFSISAEGNLSTAVGSGSTAADLSSQTISGNFSGLNPDDQVVANPSSFFNFNAHLSQLVSGENPLLQGSFSLLTQETALTALDSFKAQLETLSSSRSMVGAAQSRVEVASRVLDVSREQSTLAASRITDVDIAESTAELIRLNILQQSGAAVLAQANLQPQIALSLLTQNN